MVEIGFTLPSEEFPPADLVVCWAEKEAEVVVCGPDPEKHLDAIREYADAGYDHIYVHQIGPDQEGGIRFYERQVLPKIG